MKAELVGGLGRFFQQPILLLWHGAKYLHLLYQT